MRLLILPLALFAGFGPAVPAQACDYAAQFVQGAPQLSALVPTNAQAYALAPFMGRTPMHAELVDPRGFAPIPVDVASLGEDVVQLKLPPLDPSIQYTARIWMDAFQPEEYLDFEFETGAGPDLELPPDVVNSWQVHEGPANSCENSGWYIDVQVEHPRDADVVLYELIEVLPNDEIIVLGAYLVRQDTPTDLRFSAHVGSYALNDRCFGQVPLSTLELSRRQGQWGADSRLRMRAVPARRRLSRLGPPFGS